MQGLIVDALTSKRIPAANKAISFQRAVADYAAGATYANPNRHAALASDPTAKAATSRGVVAHVASSGASEVTRVYTGMMRMTGTASATNGAHGTWSGSMSDSLTMIVNGAGSGIGYEHFSGVVTLTVTQPDGTTKSASSSLVFTTPDFNVRKGKFQFSQNSGLDFDGLYFTLNLSGGFSNGQAAVSEKLGLPFSEFTGDVSISGALKGASTLTTPPLSIAGAAANQLASGKITPFGNLVVTDLSNATVTATVTLSNPHNGTLTNLAGGSYKPAKGIYTISGTEAVVNSALEGLVFKPHKLSSPTSQVTTGFKVTVTDSQGASLTDGTTSVVAVNPISVSGVLKHSSTRGTRGISPFRGVTVSSFTPALTLNDTVKVTLSNPENGTLKTPRGGVYNKNTGVFVFHGTAQRATKALRGLIFTPSESPKSPVATTFTISARNSAGTFTASTTVTDNPPKAGTAGADVALFSQYVALGLHAIRDHAAAISPLQDQSLSSHFEFAASHR